MTNIPGYPPVNQYQPPHSEPKKPFYKKVWFWLVVALVLIIIAALVNTPKESNSNADERPALSQPREEPAPVVPETDSLSSGEQAYLATLDQGDIFYSSPEAAVEVANRTCEALDAGVPTMTLIQIGVDEGGYSYYDSGYIIGAAIGAICPEHIDKVG